MGGELDIGEQLIPLLLLCSYDWVGPSSIAIAFSTLHMLNFNRHSHHNMRVDVEFDVR